MIVLADDNEPMVYQTRSINRQHARAWIKRRMCLLKAYRWADKPSVTVLRRAAVGDYRMMYAC